MHGKKWTAQIGSFCKLQYYFSYSFQHITPQLLVVMPCQIGRSFVPLRQLTT